MSALHPATFVAVSFLALYASWIDAREMTIPNWLNLSILGVFAVRWAAAPETVSLPDDLVLGAGVFALAWIIHSVGVFGGGDLKFVSALTFWFGVEWAPEFLTWTAIVGGLFSIAVLAANQAASRGFTHPRQVIDKLMPGIKRDKAPRGAIAYGPAITVGTLIVLWQQASAAGLT